MRIAINCRSFSKRHYTGIGRYAYNLVKSLSEIDHENEYDLYLQKGPFDTQRQIPKIEAENFHVKIDRFKRGLEKTLGKIDVYHSPSPDELSVDTGKIVVTVHDLVYKAYPKGHTQETLETTQRQLEEIVNKAAKIICCSENTRRDLHKYFTVDQTKTCVIYQGVDKKEFYPLDDKEKQAARRRIEAQGIKDPFILFVGTVEPRKNLENLIRAYTLLKSQKKFKGKLVCAGMKGWMNEEEISGLIERLGLKNDVVFLGYVTNEALRYFYNMAEVFVFPSFYEGFGFPIVEALSCGAAVVTSNVSSCPEIAKDAAMIVDPYKSEDIALAIERIMADGNFKRSLKEKALKRAQEFSFTKTAEETLKVYQEVAGKGSK